MNTTRLKQARRLFQHDLAPAPVVRHNIRQWARSVRLLGPRWRAVPLSREALVRDPI
jgi:hypothetical protein